MLALELIIMTLFGFIGGYALSFWIGAKVFYKFKIEVEAELLKRGIKINFKETK